MKIKEIILGSILTILCPPIGIIYGIKKIESKEDQINYLSNRLKISECHNNELEKIIDKPEREKKAKDLINKKRPNFKTFEEAYQWQKRCSNTMIDYINGNISFDEFEKTLSD